MAGNLTNTAETLALDFLNPAIAIPTRPTSPLKVALVTAIGSESAAGTEVVPGGNAYVRQTATISAAGANTALIEWVNMPGADLLGVEVWDSAGTPVRIWYGPLAGGSFTATATGNLFTATAHGMANGTKVAFKADPGQTLPAGITANTVYFVVGQTANTFQVAATSGGAAVTLTADGSGLFIKVKSLTAGDSFQLPIGALTTSLD